MCGVGTSLHPYAPTSAYPWSSETMSRMLGLLFSAARRGTAARVRNRQERRIGRLRQESITKNALGAAFCLYPEGVVSQSRGFDAQRRTPGEVSHKGINPERVV